jgi:hypothetical protein
MPSDKFYYSGRWRRMRKLILMRDGFRCTACGRSVRGKGAARVDHIAPRREAPMRAFDPTNLRTLCPVCDNRNRERFPGQPWKIEKHFSGVDADGYPLGPTMRPLPRVKDVAGGSQRLSRPSTSRVGRTRTLNTFRVRGV